LLLKPTSYYVLPFARGQKSSTFMFARFAPGFGSVQNAFIMINWEYKTARKPDYAQSMRKNKKGIRKPENLEKRV
jgi:hypothetical protein